MNRSWIRAIAPGLAWAAAFPPANIAGAAWITPLLLVVCGVGRSPFRTGYLAGLAAALLSYSWLLHIPFPAGAVAGWLALSAYLALYPALWLWLGEKALEAAVSSHPAVFHPPAQDPHATATRRTLPGCSDLLASAMQLPMVSRFRWVVGMAAAWTALEWFRGWFLTGFPWDFLGVSQWQLLPLVQLASVTGVYGVGFVVVWASLSIGSVFGRMWFDGGRSRAWQLEALPLVVGLGVLGWWGISRVGEGRGTEPRTTLRVALIQPSIPQTLLWDASQHPVSFQKLIRLTKEALQSRPDLVVWPEASIPSLTEENVAALTDLVSSNRVWMILGADDHEPRTPDAGGGVAVYDYYNSAFLLGRDGRLAGRYRKRRLVIFGEYVPLADAFPFLRKLTPIQGGFRSGPGPRLFELGDLGVMIAPQICFEDVFPSHARGDALLGPDVLLNITNDGWFGASAAQWQHAASASFRAVENGIPLVRATNNGLSCSIDPWGRVDFGLEGGGADIHRPGFKLLELAVGTGPAGGTVYRRYGDWFPAVCGAWCALVGGGIALRSTRRSQRLPG